MKDFFVGGKDAVQGKRESKNKLKIFNIQEGGQNFGLPVFGGNGGAGRAKLAFTGVRRFTATAAFFAVPVMIPQSAGAALGRFFHGVNQM